MWMDSVELPGVSAASPQEDTEDLNIPRAAINKMIKGQDSVGWRERELWRQGGLCR